MDALNVLRYAVLKIEYRSRVGSRQSNAVNASIGFRVFEAGYESLVDEP
jgi:hypothetical protein